MINKVKSWLEKSLSAPLIQSGSKEELSLNREADIPQGSLGQLYQARSRRKVLWLMALPIIFQNLVQHMQIVIDRRFLGRLDIEYLSALGNVMTPYNALTLFLIASSTGLTVLIAGHLGANRPAKAGILAENSFVFSTVFAILLYLVWLLGSDQIFAWLGARGAVKTYAVQYVRILALSLFFMGADTTAAATLQGAGVTLPILITGLFKNALNILLDWLLIEGRLGLPALGIEGAAWASLISNLLGSAALVVYVLRTRRLPFRFSLPALLKPRFRPYWKTMRLGLPSGLESLLWFAGQLVLTRLINEQDPLGMGIVSLVKSITMLALFVYLGFARAATTIVGQLYGARRPDLGRAAGFQAQWTSLGVSLVWGLVIVLFPGWLAGLFTREAGVIRDSIPLLYISAAMINFQSVNVGMGHAIRGTGDTRWMLYTQIGGTAFVVLFGYLVLFPLGWGLKGLFVTLLLDELLRALVNTWRFAKGDSLARRPGTAGSSPFEKQGEQQ